MRLFLTDKIDIWQSLLSLFLLVCLLNPLKPSTNKQTNKQTDIYQEFPTQKQPQCTRQQYDAIPSDNHICLTYQNICL